MALATLSIDIVAKLAQFDEQMGRMSRIAEKNAASVEQAMARVSSSIQTLGAGVSLAAVTGFVRGIIDGVDALNDLKAATGSSIENISALENIAGRTGTSFDTVGTALVKFNKALADSQPDNPISMALEKIGLSAAELKKDDPSEALRKTAVALAGYADDGDKARLMNALFGKSLREVGKFMKDLGEQDRKSVV